MIEIPKYLRLIQGSALDRSAAARPSKELKLEILEGGGSTKVTLTRIPTSASIYKPLESAKEAMDLLNNITKSFEELSPQDANMLHDKVDGQQATDLLTRPILPE